MNCETKQRPTSLTQYSLISLGNIHVLRNQDLGFSDPPPPPFVITFSTERNQKLPFSDPPLSPLCDYVIHGCSLSAKGQVILKRFFLADDSPKKHLPGEHPYIT